jgi:glycosyltransferase involved in cell wall biosynthesis
VTVSLIISIYNSPDFLDRVLSSVARQTVMPEEVIVSEDGEFPANRGVVQQWHSRWPKNSKLIHLRQRDQGNRKPLAMNKAVAISLGDYLIFIDGDCVLRRDFVSDHILFANEKSFLTGRRVELSPKASTYLTRERIDSGYLDTIPWALLFDALFGRTHHGGRFFRVPVFLRKILGRDKILDIRGCNFSVHRKHLVAINGFTNDFSGAYGEDTDAEYRLKYLGLEMKSLRGAAVQYHLWHPYQTKDTGNQERLKDLLAHPEARTSNGLAEAPRIP